MRVTVAAVKLGAPTSVIATPCGWCEDCLVPSLVRWEMEVPAEVYAGPHDGQSLGLQQLAYTACDDCGRLY